MAELEIDPAVLEVIKQGEAVLFVGAGFSLLPESPSRDRKGLRDVILQQFRATLNSSPYNVDELSLEDIVFSLRVQGISKRAIRDVVRDFLASSSELTKLQSFTLLRSIVTIRPRLFEAIITTNWDTGLEDSLKGVPHVVVDKLVSDADCLQFNSAHLSILKIHGDIDDAESLVLSAQDFDVFEKEHRIITERLRILFATKYVVLLGYGARDENFRRIFRSLHYDVGTRLRGGWIVAPELGDREKLWAPTVQLVHVPTTAQTFLSSLLTHIGKIRVGSSQTIPARAQEPLWIKTDSSLSTIARRIEKRFGLAEVWVTSLGKDERPNRAVGRVAARYIEARCRSARSIAISTGETMDELVEVLDTTVFRNSVRISPTIVLLAGPRGYGDPSHLAQRLVARFPQGRAVGVSLRLPDESYLLELFPHLPAPDVNGVLNAVRAIGAAQVELAVRADVIVSSVRPLDWFGGGDGVPAGRTIPLQFVPGLSATQTSNLLRNAGAAAIHQMIVLNADGEDVVAASESTSKLRHFHDLICRPSVDQLRTAAAGRQQVILVAAHAEKARAVKAVLVANLCNVLVLDSSLAEVLAND